MEGASAIAKALNLCNDARATIKPPAATLAGLKWDHPQNSLSVQTLAGLRYRVVCKLSPESDAAIFEASFEARYDVRTDGHVWYVSQEHVLRASGLDPHRHDTAAAAFCS
jgi:hypothetical protein